MNSWGFTDPTPRFRIHNPAIYKIVQLEVTGIKSLGVGNNEQEDWNKYHGPGCPCNPKRYAIKNYRS